MGGRKVSLSAARRTLSAVLTSLFKSSPKSLQLFFIFLLPEPWTLARVASAELGLSFFFFFFTHTTCVRELLARRCHLWARQKACRAAARARAPSRLTCERGGVSQDQPFGFHAASNGRRTPRGDLRLKESVCYTLVTVVSVSSMSTSSFHVCVHAHIWVSD